MKRHITILLTYILSSGLYAQNITPQVLSSAGNKFQNSSMSIEWTLGELSINTIKGTNGIITQGFHQPKYIITTVNELKTVIGDVHVYPNPTADLIQMKMAFEKVQTVQVLLFDMNGKKIWNNKFYGRQILESASLKNLPNGSYFLNFIIEENKSTQSFKILKTH